MLITKTLKFVIQAIDAVSERTGRLVAYLCIPTIVVIMVEVAGRYFFRSPFLWSHEMTAFMVGILYTLGGAYVLKLDEHVSVDLIYNLLGRRGKAVMEVFSSIVFFVYMIPLSWYGLNYAFRSISILQRSGSTWNPPVYHLKAVLVFGILLVLLAGVSRFVKVLHSVITGRNELWTLD